MSIILSLVVHTINVLGIFNDPFEFAGDYGPEMNPTRQKVFQLVVPQENPSKDYGPTLADVVTPQLEALLTQKQQELSQAGFDQKELQDILSFLHKNQSLKIFHYVTNSPSILLNLDATLKNKAAHEGKPFDLQILSSTALLEGNNSEDLKENFLNQIFTAETLSLTKNPAVVRQALSSHPHHELFSTRAGQTFFYWLYQAINLQLISPNQEMIASVNKVKTLFANTLGSPSSRAALFKQKFIAAGSGVIFSQESDTFFADALVQDNLFLPLTGQPAQDGCFVFLRSDLWNESYQVIPIHNYDGYAKGKLNVILATYKSTGQPFLLAAAHGNSSNPEDGRLQMTFVMEKFKELQKKYPTLQLLIGTDANTKSSQDVADLRKHLDNLGLVATTVGPTTIKKRMVTAQFSKGGKLAVDTEDYLIMLKPEMGGRFLLVDQTVGFSHNKPDHNVLLPNIHNPSDHYPVGATL